MVRPQVHARAEAVIAETEKELVRHVKAMLGQHIEGRVVQRLLLMRPVEEKKRIILSPDEGKEHALYKLVERFDLMKMEVAFSEEGVVVDAHIEVDDRALFRHPVLAAMKDGSQMGIKEAQAERFGLYHEQKCGRIGCLATSRALLGRMEEALERFGGEISAVVSLERQENKEQFHEALSLLKGEAKALFITLAPETMNLEVWALWLYQAASTMKIPYIVRLIGGDRESAKALLRRHKRLYVVDSLKEAAAQAVIEAGLL